MNKAIKQVLTIFKNGIRFKFPNKKIFITRKEKDKNLVSFVRILEKGETTEADSVQSEIFKDKVLVTKLLLSDDALANLYFGIGQYIKHQKSIGKWKENL